MDRTFANHASRIAGALLVLSVLGACAEAPQVERRAASTAVDCRNEYRKARIAADSSSAQNVAEGTGGASSSGFAKSMGSMFGYMQTAGREDKRLRECYDAVGAPAHERRPVNDFAMEGQSTGYAGNRPSIGGGVGFSNY